MSNGAGIFWFTLCVAYCPMCAFFLLILQVLSGRAQKIACWQVSSQTTSLVLATLCLQVWPTSSETGVSCSWPFLPQASSSSSTSGELQTQKGHNVFCYLSVRNGPVLRRPLFLHVFLLFTYVYFCEFSGCFLSLHVG